MNKRYIYLGIGIVLAIVAIMIVNNRFLEREKLIQRLIAEGKITEVVTAIRDIPRGENITSNMVRLERVPTKALQPGVLYSLDSVVGKLAKVNILQKQYIYANMLEFPYEAISLSDKTPKGKRAMTVSMDRISAVNGQIKAGDNVDIVGIFQIPTQQGAAGAPIAINLFQNIKVLSVATEARTLVGVTVALTPEEIKILSLALEVGKIKLTLRYPLDTSEDKAEQAITYVELLQKLGLYRPVPPPPKEKVIEVYEGGKKTK